ncbi:MAG: UvrD-helicase domain-containing protein, partial [Clostridia bacterium]|nr:UvrD-helicase domain-containing protein [Clostridia bacterium]
FSDDIDFIDRVLAACDRRVYEDISTIFSAFSPVRLGVVRNAELSPDIEKAKSVRKKFHDERKELAGKFFSLTPDELQKNRLDTADTLNKLYTLLCAFTKRFNDEKRRRSLVDFGDLERLAYKMLVENGKPSIAAKTVAEKFDEIYIDEYQDVNAVQDAIFSAVSRGDNRFMVGDIKQSIYAFRGAEPRIFADYRRKFGRLDDGNTKSGAAVFLSNNFRCDKSVIDFSNIVSGCLFTSGRGDIPFTNDDLLIHSKVDTESGEPVHVVLVDGSGEDSTDDIDSREAEYIASEITRLLADGRKNDGTLIKPSDIAILMRSAKAHSAALEVAFDRRGIPYYNNVSANFFENAEILLALCILNIIDNPTRDIYLAGALKSPVFAFTLDELIKIRRTHQSGSLYDALCAYSEKESFQKGLDFLETLERWRTKASGMPIDRLLWYIYTDTDLLALVYDNENATRRANLMLLYEYARRFEASSFKGLYNFIRYVNDILDQKAEFENAKVFGEASDTVKLMTIHQSKGLEFPVCFICGTGKKFNENDLRANIVIERSLGIALKLADTTGFARYDTPIRQALVKRLADSQLEEEMRVLYVALTRARERLYITALASDAQEMLDTAASDAERLSRYVIMKNGGYMRWILTALAHHEKSGNSDAPVTIDIIRPSTETEQTEIQPQKGTIASDKDNSEIMDLVRERFDFVYPKSAASRLPAKLSVSKLTPTILDDDAAELEDTYEEYSFEAKRPLFLDKNAAPTATGAERGTATHLFMQFCDFSRFIGASDDLVEIIEDEAARLAEKKFITPRAASLINVRGLARFFAGDTFAEICSSPRIWREHRFNVKLPASDFTKDSTLAAELTGESVLVQGVIDCFFENPDGTLTLIDYKTDYTPPELTHDEAMNMLRERHSLQLSYYKAACEKISARRVSRVAVYSFALGCAIEM